MNAVCVCERERDKRERQKRKRQERERGERERDEANNKRESALVRVRER